MFIVGAGIGNNVLNGLVNFLLPFVGIAFVIGLVIEGWRWKQGRASLKETLLLLISFVALGGILVFAKGYFQDTSNSQGINRVVQSGTDQVTKDAGNVVRGN